MRKKHDNGNIYTINNKDLELTEEIKMASAQDRERYYYNQKHRKDHNQCCTLYAHITMLGNIMNYQFTVDEIEEVVREAEEKGYIRGKGWLTYKACDVVRNYWNTRNPDNRIVSFRAGLLEVPVREAMCKGYDVVCSLKGNSDWSKDRNEDGFIDEVEKDKPTARGHSLTLHLNQSELVFGDSYNGYRDTNVYRINEDISLKDLIMNGRLYPTCYIYLPERNLTFTKEELLMMKANSMLWNMDDDEYIRNRYHEINEHIKKRVVL